MKKLHLIYFLCFFLYYANGQDQGHVIIGNIDTIDSKILNEQREVWVYVPEGNTNAIFQAKKYPVVYLLDGDAHFYSVVGMIHQLSAVNGNTICPKMIVVGITNTIRTRDLTPTKGKTSAFADSNMIAASGGGDKFMSFIEKELMPHIDAKYPTEPYRMFIGHSFGGLMVMNTLKYNPDLFNAYVAIDPSMWWGEGELLKEIKSEKFDKKYANKSLYLGIANTMNEGMDIERVQNDTSFATAHIRSILELNTYLNDDANKQLTYKGKYYGDDTHGSVPLITEYDALRFIFEFYQLDLGMQEYMDPDSDIVEKVVKHYKKLSKVFGRDVKPEEEMVNNYGYQFMQMQQLEKSEEFFKLNVANYPESFNVYDSLGDFYVANGEKEKAIKNYKKSIKLNKDSYSKDKLKELEEK